ncbi:MAG: GMC family oxidoreductase [Chromatiales bacterium]|nr:GMC family oxidoreductase [Chromatiales bacterium]
MSQDFDVCVIGSGAGAGPVVWSLVQAGYSVVVLEKGRWLRDADFAKDELACSLRKFYTPKLADEQHVIEDYDGQGGFNAVPTSVSGWDFWNGNIVGGATNFMSGFFHRMRPVDFRLLSEFGPIDGANMVDWPIDYTALAPYYDRVESAVGVSGRAEDAPHAAPRAHAEYPYPPTREHPIAGWIDAAGKNLGWQPMTVPRAVLSRPANERGGCSYSGYCGSYGCATGAKGSSRVALIEPAVRTGRCKLIPEAKAYRLISDDQGRVTGVDYYDRAGQAKRIGAKLYVVACQAIETARLLLSSPGPRHADGLGNNTGQVGRNLLFSAGGSGSGTFYYADLSEDRAKELREFGSFVNRALSDWYVIDDPDFGRAKGGTIEFLFSHPNPVARANRLKWGEDGLVWGRPLKRRLEEGFRGERTLRFEVFCDWLPTDNCFVSLDPQVRDRWGSPVARVRVGYHRHDLRVGQFLSERGERLLTELGASGVNSSVSGAPPANLVAGGCRFGTDPATSVLDPDCRIHDADNVYVTDGSFMPTGGSVPYTWTIYANAFRVADRIIERLGGKRSA